MVSLDDDPPLFTGMRVDTFFEQARQSGRKRIACNDSSELTPLSRVHSK